MKKFFLAALVLVAGLVGFGDVDPAGRRKLLVFHLDFNTLQRTRQAVVSALERAADAGYNAVLWEIEDKVRFDCCPVIAAPDAFSKDEFREILAVARRLKLEPIPLMQTFGHAEYVLKHKPYLGLREDPGRCDCYCPSKPETRRFLKALLHEYLEIFGPDVRRFHLGGDEARCFATCPACKARKPMELYLEHLEAVAEELRSRGIRPGCWHDMMLKFDQDAGGGLFGTCFKDFTVWFWDYSYPKVWHPWGQSDKPLRMLMSAGCETIICGSCQSWKEDPFLVRFGEHRENLSACAALARRENLSGFCVTSWTIHQGLKQLQQPLVQFAAKRYLDPSDDEGRDWSAAVTAAFGSVPTNALDAVSVWEVRYGLADGRGWNGYKDGTVPPKDGVAARLRDGKTDAAQLSAELQAVADCTTAALSQIKDVPDGKLTSLGHLLIEAAELRLAFHRVEVKGLRGEAVGELPFEQTVRHYLRECPRESAERAARIAYAYFAETEVAGEDHVRAVVDRVLENVRKLRSADPAAVPMAFWDFDGTIIKGDSGFGLTENGEVRYRGLIQECIEAGFVSRYRMADGYLRWRRDYAHMAATSAGLSQGYDAQMFAGVSAAELDAFCERKIRESRMADWYFASSVAIWKALAEAGVENYVVSANVEALVRNVSSTLGVPRDRVRGARVELEDGRWTTRLVQPIPHGEGKAEIVRGLVGERPHGVAIAAFGNSHSTDGAFLRHVAEQANLPGGAKGTAVMINGGCLGPESRDCFMRVEQKAVVGSSSSPAML